MRNGWTGQETEGGHEHRVGGWVDGRAAGPGVRHEAQLHGSHGVQIYTSTATLRDSQDTLLSYYKQTTLP